MADRRASAKEYLAGAESLRLLQAGESRAAALLDAVTLMDRACAERRVSGLAAQVLAHIEAAGAGWPGPDLTVVASALAVPPRQVSVALARAVDRTLVDCRRALVVRRVALALAATREQVGQIAYQAGYEYPSQLVRDFQTVLGLAPREFRVLLQSCQVHDSLRTL